MMYQHFPQEEALVYALNERYLMRLEAKIEATCRAYDRACIGEMVQALIKA